MDRSSPAPRTYHPPSRRHLWLLCFSALLAGCVSDEIHEIPPEPVCATPTFQPPPGVYIDSALVSIACLTPDATIRYTLDGSTPGDSSDVYLRPIMLRTPTSLRARAEKPNYQPSEVASAAYDVRSAEIILLSPNGGEAWREGSVHAITWSRGTGCGDTARIVLLRNGVACDTISHAVRNEGLLQWTVAPCLEHASDYRVRVEDTSTGRFDESDSDFTIETNCVVEVVAPNGGEGWTIGQEYEIQWNTSGACGEFVDILLLHNGSPCKILADNYENSGTFQWSCDFCRDLGLHYTVQVIDLLTGSLDESDALFDINFDLSCPLTLLSPNGGERWVEGTEQEIRWVPNDCFGSVALSLRRNGRFARWLASATQDDGSFTWIVRRAEPDSTGYSVYIGNAGGGDQSDTTFIIAPSPEPCRMEILEPNSQTVWRAGSSPEIVWTVQDCYGTAKIEWMFNSQVRNRIDTTNDGRFQTHLWRGSYEGPCGYSIRITDSLTGTVATTDGSFCMTPCAMTVTYPAEGDTLYEGRLDWVRWELSEEGCTNYWPIRITLMHQGAECALVGDGIEAFGGYEWFVQRCVAESSGPYRLVVVEADDFADTSGAFTIDYPPRR